MNVKNLRTLNLDKIKSKKTTIVSSKEALKDITPINWNEEVKSGEKKVTIYKAN